MRWDGQQKHLKKIDALKCHIWSSATLYNKTTQQNREKWFKQLLEKHPNPDKTLLFQFHHTKKDVDAKNDMVMKRANGLETISISQVVVENKRANFSYFDLTKHEPTH